MAELTYPGPDLRSRFENNWTDEARKNFRWAYPIMGMKGGWITQSAAVIADGVPILEKGDVVDVYLAYFKDFSKGKAPIILKRICSIHDKPCIDALRAKQRGRAVGVEIQDMFAEAATAMYPRPGDTKLSPPLENYDCALVLLARFGCHGELPKSSSADTGLNN